jgi:polyhydroxyalkanoate synthase subunit PhaE
MPENQMNENAENPFDMSSSVNAWLDSMGQFWGQWVNQTTDQWLGLLKKEETETFAGHGAPPKGAQAMAETLKHWQTLGGAMVTPEFMSALYKGGSAMPEVLLKLAQTSVGSLFELHQNMLQRIAGMGATVKAYEFKDLDENIFQLWTDIYEREFRQFFKIPQLGLLRTYQEKANQMADSQNLFQSHLAEFMRMLSLPFSHSLRVLQEKLGEMAETSELSSDSKDYYNMWVKVLEGHFMTLYQTPEYVETLARTVNSLASYKAARDAALEDMLRMLPVATNADLDDMARELYEVKKRLRKIEKG